MSNTGDARTMTGAAAIVASLEALGVTDVFGMPGGAILPTYDPLMDSSINHILVRHEQGAGHAAEGYALATGKVGCAIVTPPRMSLRPSTRRWMSKPRPILNAMPGSFQPARYRPQR